MSELRATTISNLAGAGPATLTGQEGAKVRSRHNSSGSELGSSLNVSSVTDHATGDATVTFTNAMATANDFSFTMSSHSDAVTGANIVTVDNIWTPTASTVRKHNFGHSGSPVDPVSACLIVHGDLA